MSARVMLVTRCNRHPGAGFEFHEHAFPCDTWWLVESESTDAARKVIEHFERDPDATCVHGRVLAHGGGK